jgi:hypothetical protein
MHFHRILILSLFISSWGFAATPSSSEAEISTSVESHSFSNDFKTEIYGEASENTRQRDIVHYTKLTSQVYRLTEGTSFYGGAILSGDSLSTKDEIYNDNYVAPLLGVKLGIADYPVGLFAEIRQVFPQFSKENSSSSQTEFRSGIVGGLNHTLVNLTEGRGIFSDGYGELIFSSRLENNVFFNLSEKLGFEKKWNRGNSSQIYAEGYGRRDRLGYYYENLQEMRLGLRQKWSIQKITLALSSHLAAGSYTDRQYRDANPYSKSYTETAFLFVFGGLL